VNRRQLLGGFVASVAGLLIPEALAAEPERRVFALDRTMLDPRISVMSGQFDPEGFEDYGRLSLMGPNVDGGGIPQGYHKYVCSDGGTLTVIDPWKRTVFEEESPLDGSLIAMASPDHSHIITYDDDTGVILGAWHWPGPYLLESYSE